jgi:hypothetical protein
VGIAVAAAGFDKRKGRRAGPLLKESNSLGVVAAGVTSRPVAEADGLVAAVAAVVAAAQSSTRGDRWPVRNADEG